MTNVFRPGRAATASAELTADERAVSDAIRAAALPMLNAEPQAVHFPTLARAALSVMTRLAQVPAWAGPRTVGSRHAQLTVDLVESVVDGDEPMIELRSTSTIGDGPTMLVSRADARAFFLAGLAACSDDAQVGATGDGVVIDMADQPEIAGGDCATTPGTVTLSGTTEPEGHAP
jgi:hypothetical protein